MALEHEKITILLVEDNEIDVMGVKRAFEKSGYSNPIVVAGDGLDALELLRDGTSVKRPYLTLLDLNMPRMNGIEFLDQIRKDPELQASIVFVLTTSKAPDDMKKGFDRHIAGYIVKDKKEEGFIGVAQLLERYSTICEFPQNIQ